MTIQQNWTLLTKMKKLLSFLMLLSALVSTHAATGTISSTNFAFPTNKIWESHLILAENTNNAAPFKTVSSTVGILFSNRTLHGDASVDNTLTSSNIVANGGGTNSLGMTEFGSTVTIFGRLINRQVVSVVTNWIEGRFYTNDTYNADFITASVLLLSTNGLNDTYQLWVDDTSDGAWDSTNKISLNASGTAVTNTLNLQATVPYLGRWVFTNSGGFSGNKIVPGSGRWTRW
jgi:hypothetical protein